MSENTEKHTKEELVKNICNDITSNKIKKVTIIGHEGPDADVKYSQLLMSNIIYSLNRNVECQILFDEPNVKIEGDIVIVLDCNIRERVNNKRFIEYTNPVYYIDHHEDKCTLPKNSFKYIDPYAESTGLMLFQMFHTENINWTRQMYQYVMNTLVFDTNIFTTVNTRKDAFEVVSQLVINGANVTEAVNLTKSLTKDDIINIGLLIDKMKVRGNIAIIKLNGKIPAYKINDIVYRMEGINKAIYITNHGYSVRCFSPDINLLRLTDNICGKGHKSAAFFPAKSVSLESLINALLN